MIPPDKLNLEPADSTSITSEVSHAHVVVTVHGTCGRRDAWAESSNKDWTLLPNRTVVHPFEWCGQIDGLLGADDCWETWGAVLAQTLVGFHTSIPRPHITVVAHSHGGQVAAYALSDLADTTAEVVDLFVTVSTPNRKSLLEQYEKAYDNTKLWVHCYGDWWLDWVSSLGRLGTKWTPSLKRSMVFADINERMAGHGHTSMLYDSLFYAFLHHHMAGKPVPWQALKTQSNRNQ